MKLILVLSIIAYGYADKLDRAYLPPANAASSGGSPGSLTAPAVQPEAFGQGLPVSGGQQGLSGFGKPITGQNGLSGHAQNNPRTTTFGSTYNPSGVENTRVASSDNGYGTSTGINVPSGSNSLAPSVIQQFSSNGLSASNQNFPSSGVQSTTGPFNQGLAQGAQGLNAQVYNQERPQAAAERNAETLKYINENNGQSYAYSYETSNRIFAEESGVATNGVMAQGGYTYTGDDGKTYSVSYTADENGYQPQGEHLPTPHPIPEEILKSIEENAKAAAAGIQEGAYRPEEYESEVSSQQYNFGSGASYQSKSGQEQSRGPTSNPTQINQYQTTNQGIREQNLPIGQSSQDSLANQQYNKGAVSGQGIRLPYQGISQQNNQGIIQKSSESYRPKPYQTEAQGGVGGQLLNQSPNLGSTTQNFGQFTQAQGSGYQYNQPQNALQPTTFTQGTTSQYRPNGQGQNTFSSGPSTTGSVFKDNLKPSLGNRPSTNLYRPQQPQSQLGSGQQTASTYRPQSESDRPLNQGTSFPTQGQNNQINEAFGSQQGKPTDQGYQYHPQQPSSGFNKPTLINSAVSHNEGTSNQPSYNANNKQNQGPQSSFYGSSKQEFQQSGKKPSFGSSDSSSQNSQFFNTIQKGAPANNQAGQSPQFSHNPHKSSFNYNQTPDKVSQYQQTGNQASSGNRQPVQGSQLPSSGQRFGTNTLAQRPTAGSRPVQVPYQYNQPSQSFKPEPSNFLPLESSSSNGKPAQGNKDRNEEFGGPRQPPSFSSQEGYKY